MIEYTSNTDEIFSCLADQTRRDILIRVSQRELNISQIAHEYDISIAAVSKHIQLLESAGLIVKRRDGKERYVNFVDGSLNKVEEYISSFPTLSQEVN